MLKTNLEKGILGDDADLLRRRNAFGSNTYPRKKGRSFWVFISKILSFEHHFVFFVFFYVLECTLVDDSFVWSLS